MAKNSTTTEQQTATTTETTVVVDTTAADTATAAVTTAPVLEAAPTDLFDTATASSNPERVNMIKLLVKEYASSAGSAQSNATISRSAFLKLVTGLNQLVTLTGTDVAKALDSIIAVIANDKTKAFDAAYLFRDIDAVRQKAERQRAISLLNLLTRYASLKNKKMISELVDLNVATAEITNPASRKAIIAYFTK